MYIWLKVHVTNKMTSCSQFIQYLMILRKFIFILRRFLRFSFSSFSVVLFCFFNLVIFLIFGFHSAVTVTILFSTIPCFSGVCVLEYGFFHIYYLMFFESFYMSFGNGKNSSCDIKVFCWILEIWKLHSMDSNNLLLMLNNL